MAGALVGWTGGPLAFGAATALSIGAVFLLSGLREPACAAASGRHAFREIREGARFVFGHRLLRPVFITQLAFNGALFTLQAVYVPYRTP